MLTQDTHQIASSSSSVDQVESNSVSSFESPFTNLRKSLLFDSKCIKKPSSRTSLLNIQKELSKHIFRLNIDKIAENLTELLDMEITPELINSTKLTKVLNYFVKSYSHDDDYHLVELAELAKGIYFKLKNISICSSLRDCEDHSDRIRNPELREKVCKRVISILSANGFEVNESESMAISIENNIRKRDPTMEKQYIKFIKKMIKDIKDLDKISYLRSEEIS